MAKTLRVKLDPVTESGSGPRRVLGATVRLTRLGAGSTAAQPDSPSPASLTFFGRFFERLRNDEGTDPERLAGLRGSIELQSATDDVLFVVEAGGAPGATLLEHDEPLESPADPEASSPPRRRLVLQLDSSQFPGLPPLDLVLPARATDFIHVEVLAELEVGVAVEASRDKNDVLDVPLTQAAPSFVPAFEARIVDEVGEPLADLEVTFEASGRTVPKRTDDLGVARFYDATATVAIVSLPSASELRKILKPRWDQVRGKPVIRAAKGVHVILVHDEMDSNVPVEVGAPVVVSLQPRVERARLVRFFFDTNKTFVLPDLPEAMATIAALYERNTPSKMLVVGHADTAGPADYNDKLSLERAETLLDYLEDDVDAWLKWYGGNIAEKKRWGTNEDLAMIAALPDAGERDPDEAPVRWFQRTRGLAIDGIGGPKTRRALITEYMARDKTKLPPSIEATVHGCGEHFPETGSRDDTAAPDDRRAELFFFDDELGIQPPPPGKNSRKDSQEYPEWVRRANSTDAAGTAFRTLAIKLVDSLDEPLPDAPYELKVSSEVRSGRTDQAGFLFEENVPVPNRCTLRWRYPEDPEEPEQEASDEAALPFVREVFLDYKDFDEVDNDEAARRRLHNLGYLNASLQVNVRDFQRDADLPEAPWFDQPTFEHLRIVHDRP